MKFYTINIYVDIDTGETLSIKRVTEEYRILKKIRHVKQPKRTESTRVIEYTNVCKRKLWTQGEIWK